MSEHAVTLSFGAELVVAMPTDGSTAENEMAISECRRFVGS
jgi:hypothetical protein